ncbi:MAG: hypothetical protein J5574_01135, partial [Lachnospiraceae bacterium]|nr:hypothetical protein [Lachnospiraceae bacterium]
FAVADFGAYIESIVSGKNYDIKMWYTYASAAVIAVLTVIFTVRFIVIVYKSKQLKEYIKW